MSRSRAVVALMILAVAGTGVVLWVARDEIRYRYYARSLEQDYESTSKSLIESGSRSILAEWHARRLREVIRASSDVNDSRAAYHAEKLAICEEVRFLDLLIECAVHSDVRLREPGLFGIQFLVASSKPNALSPDEIDRVLAALVESSEVDDDGEYLFYVAVTLALLGARALPVAEYFERDFRDRLATRSEWPTRLATRAWALAHVHGFDVVAAADQGVHRHTNLLQEQNRLVLGKLPDELEEFIEDVLRRLDERAVRDPDPSRELPLSE